MHGFGGFNMRFTLRTTLSLVLAILALTITGASAERPDSAQRSPWQHVEQQVGDSFIEMEYSRPGVRGREVYGTDLVPYDGSIWRAGANARTTISFESDVSINGKPLKAGTYAILVIASPDEWTFIFSKNFMAHGADGYTEKNDALRITAKPRAAEHEEFMVFEFTNLTDNSVDINLHWEKIRCGFKVELGDS
jgi:hypothetical protein